MLIRFEVSNFRSILEPVELSMVAVDRDRPEARAFDNIGESLLPVAAIYGPNASGKSNLLAALTWLRKAVRESLHRWDRRVPIEPFAGSAESRDSEFTIEMMTDGVRFEYVVELDHEGVEYEGLFHYPEKKRRRLFEREGERLTLQRGLGGISGVRELLTPRTLALSAARRFDEPVVSDFARRLSSGRSIGLDDRYLVEDDESHLVMLGEGLADTAPAEARSRALSLLRLADLGIEDVAVDRRDGWYRVSLVHRSEDRRFALDLDAESHGTRTWLLLIGPVLHALGSGGSLLFDEIDASLHPTLSAELIRMFHDPATNPKGAQLIFTSHDTSLLNHLNRDEVWLTEKRADGSTRLGALAEFAGERVRKSQNLERAYLQGRFGALPDVDRTELLRTLGLIG